MLEAKANWLGKNLESGARRISTFNGTFDGVTRRHRRVARGSGPDSTSEWRVIREQPGQSTCPRWRLHDQVACPSTPVTLFTARELHPSQLIPKSVRPR